MPVIIIEHADDAVPLAEALLAGGIALPKLPCVPRSTAIEQIASGCPDMLVRAGTITSSEQAQQVKDAGGVFGVSHSSTEAHRCFNRLVCRCYMAHKPMR